MADPVAAHHVGAAKPVVTAQDAYDALADSYDTSFQGKKSLAEDLWLKRFLRDGGWVEGSVLDAACGTGLVLDLLGERISSASYGGFDISPGMLARAREKHPGYSFKVGDMGAQLPISRTYDRLLCLFCSFTYCMTPEKALRNFHTALKPGGSILLMAATPLYATRKTYIVNSLGVEVPRRFSTAEELHDQLENAGFGEVEIRGLSRVVDVLPESLPQPVFNTVLNLEAATLGLARPDSCYILVASARRF